MDLEAWLPILILPVFVAVFIAFWKAILLLLSVVGGWRSLARRYRTDLPEPRWVDTFSVGRLGVVNYNWMLQVGGTAEHLRLAPQAMFGTGHPPLAIPWDHVREDGKPFHLLFKCVRLRLGPPDERGVALVLRADAWEKCKPRRVAAIS